MTARWGLIICVFGPSLGARSDAVQAQLVPRPRMVDFPNWAGFAPLRCHALQTCTALDDAGKPARIATTEVSTGRIRHNELCRSTVASSDLLILSCPPIRSTR